MSEITRQQLVDRINAAETEFSDMDLSNMDLSEIDISGCNFHAANFENSDLTGVTASYVDVSSANFKGAILDAVFAEQINLYGTERNVAASMEQALIIEDTTVKDMQIK